LYICTNYTTTAGFADPLLHFTLSKIGVPFGGVTASTRLVSVPMQNTGNYARQVFGPAAVVNYCKWQGVVYAVEGSGSKAVITSTDNGETWQRQTGVPS
jgi:hypothetical protein